MFYSQFILAKKGPLGTIWIAAHLERKLRKNQVADTDIGVSVDSILFPEAPIALRLSSHLLLGVVRIYSRKVNYLFDDCSEALLKIKQAFRSTAVDLPPEESKAPYHSITLPETFDLDDFELPDNEFFQGNYVDHHISSREQITLQDNMENIVYSTSQFGLDERFGDGDTSGLDLDEELFLDKVNAAGHTGLSVDPQTSMQPIMPLKRHEHVDRMPTISEARIEAASGDADLMDYAQAPCTPGLVEEPNLSNVQETSACDDHMESEDNILTESAVKENMKTDSCKSNVNQGSAHVVDWSLPADTNSVAVRHKPCEENGYHSSDLRIKRGHSLHPEVNIEHISSDDPASASGTSFVAAKEVITSPEPNLAENVIAASDNLDKREELQNGLFKIDGVDGLSIDSSNKGHGECNGIISKESVRDNSCLSSPHQQVPEGISNNNQEECTNGVIAGNSEKPYSPSGALGLDTELQAISCLGKTENGVSQESVDSDLLNLSVQDEMQCAQVHHLRPCSAGMGPLDSSNDQGEQSNDLSSEIDANPPLEACEGGLLINASGSVAVEQGKNFHEVDDSEQNVTENRAAEHALLEVINPGSGKSDDQVNVVGGDGTLQNVNIPAGMDFPPPEKLLSLPEGFVHEPKDLLVEATPGDLAGVDESDAGSRIISGKKRSYTESTLTEQSLNSVESSRVVRTKRTVEAIPDDDDLLSSILVGRRSSALKVKPTPPPSEITSLKRHRSASRTSAFKRKVLMDDTMVLHGDIIRQQLTNTEDIRRIRKKAPCTWPEIAMIQKQFLEEDIFGEPIWLGVSMELASLHNQTYDLSAITITQDDVSNTSLLAETDMKLTSGNDEDVHDVGIDNVMGPGVPTTIVASDMGGVGELAVGIEILQPSETPLPTEYKMDEDHDVIAEADITQQAIKHTKDGVVAAETSSLWPEHSQYLPEHTVDGGSCSNAEAVAPAYPSEIESRDHLSGDFGHPFDGALPVSALDNSSVMDAPVVSSDDKKEECLEVDASLIDGSDGRTDDEKEGAVKDDDIVAAVDIKPGARDGISSESYQHGATVETERNSNEQGEYNACGPSIEIETDMGRVEYHDQLFHDVTSAEQPIVSSSYPAECVNVQGSSLGHLEYAMQQEAYLANAIDAEISGFDLQDREDFNYTTAANDTEFLNVDDDEVAEVTDDYTPNPEEIRFTENSGWSSRTRAVAKYLQTLFTKEAECGRKALPVDNLLTGKTRKEASRMFFEALVLKTRDYIHVEQERPFDNITIKPRMKLMKSDF